MYMASNVNIITTMRFFSCNIVTSQLPTPTYIVTSQLPTPTYTPPVLSMKKEIFKIEQIYFIIENNPQ